MAPRNPTDMGGAFAGVPMCSRERCASYDGKRCGETGNEPGEVCVPEVRAQHVTLGAIATMLTERAPRLFQIVHYCSICRAKFATDDEVRAHQAECAEHPAVKAATKLRRLLEEALDAWYRLDPSNNEDERRNLIRKEAGL